MDIQFRSIQHPQDETTLGQVFWFHPADGCDSISATANTNGITPLLAVERHFNLGYDKIIDAAAACNQRGEVAILQVNPTLFLVPATKGKGDAHFLMEDLIAATKAAKVSGLHFTHFGFIQNRLPNEEVRGVLDYLFRCAASTHLARIVIDIDARVENVFYEILRSGTAPTTPVVPKGASVTSVITS